MFCSKCGAQIKDGAAFCQKCGAGLSGENRQNTTATNQQVYSSMPNKNQQTGNHRLIGMIGTAVIALVAIIVIVKVVGIFNGGYEKVIEKYLKAIQEEDGELLCSIYPPEYIDYLVGPGSFYSDEEDLAEDFTEECKDRHEDLSGGIEKHPDIEYDIVSEEKLEKEELESLNRSLKNDYDFENTVSEAYYVTFEVYIPGGEKVYTVERYLLKIRGKWYMGRGI